MGEPIQIISFDGDRKLKLNKVELEKTMSQEGLQGLPIAVLSVVGAFRTGKSSLLNWMERFLSSSVKGPGWLTEGITSYDDESTLKESRWRSDPDPETHGIWAWSEVFIINGTKDEKVGVLLMDTQGLFDAANTSTQNGFIFTLSTLISSIQIFNLSQKMQEDDLGNLELFAEFERFALNNSRDSSTAAVSTMKPFQRIVFLIRDWPYQKRHAYGSQGGADYLETYLNVPEEMEGTELSVRRRHIRQYFDQVDCYLMPHPGEKVANDDDDFDGRPSEMEDEFKDQLETLLFFLFPNGTAKPKMVAGTRVLANDLTDYVESYVDLLNSEQGLSALSIFEATVKIHNNSLARDALKEYKALVTSFEKDSGTFLEEDDLMMNHEELQKKVLEQFYEHRMGDTESICFDEKLSQLKKDIDEELENWKSRNELLKLENLPGEEEGVSRCDDAGSSDHREVRHRLEKEKLVTENELEMEKLKMVLMTEKMDLMKKKQEFEVKKLKDEHGLEIERMSNDFSIHH